MKVAGLFSGIGGFEMPFKNRGATTKLICENWESAQAVLKKHFPEVPLHGDVRSLACLPKDTDVVTAGFPCTDLSQAGRTAGITGQASGLVSHVFRLVENSGVEWLVLENVKNMLVLDKGEAMRYLTAKLESLKFRWAYRVVDSRFTGVPQRRQRVLLVASRGGDPRKVLFADEAGGPDDFVLKPNAYGFYWTEGLTGLGWAKDAVPPLKGGSSVGIPSPPAIWIPKNPLGRRLVTPTIQAAEMLQGFERNWTGPAQTGRANGPRWKLVGNAVTTGVALWLAGRLFEPGEPLLEGRPISDLSRWPDAAYGERGRVWQFRASEWPVRVKYQHLIDVVSDSDVAPLSARAALGFYQRTCRSKLHFESDFLEDVLDHAKFQTSVIEFQRACA